MKKIIASSLLSICAMPAFAEKTAIELSEFSLIGNAQVVEHQGKKAIKIGQAPEGKFIGFGQANLSEAAFDDGIIDAQIFFDKTRTFAGLGFRSDAQNNWEEFYLRAHQSGNPDANTYSTTYNGQTSWQLYYGETTSHPTNYSHGEWFPIRYVVQGDLMDVYIEDMEAPKLTVALEQEKREGGILLWGLGISEPVWFADISIEHDAGEIVGTPIPEKPMQEGTITSWSVSNAFPHEAVKGQLDRSFVEKMTKISTDQRGMANLTQVQPTAEGQDTVLAEFTVSTQRDRLVKMDYGFSDDVTIYVNGKAISSASDRFFSRDYRFLGTVGWWDAAWIDLKKGVNTVSFAVTESAEDPTGWAVQARIVEHDGLAFGLPQ